MNVSTSLLAICDACCYSTDLQVLVVLSIRSVYDPQNYTRRTERPDNMCDIERGVCAHVSS